MLTIALPKGRLGDKVARLLDTAGYGCKALNEDTRKLILQNEDNTLRYLLVKPTDVAVIVEHGAADLGIVGKDILIETEPDVYELLDLDIGKCRMCVAAPSGFLEDRDRPLRVGTKYVNIAKKYYASQNREIQILSLSGSIELAPLLKLTDVIVDLVETGTTLAQNDLRIIREIFPVSARLIANRSSFLFKTQDITAVADKLGACAGA